MLAKSVIWPAGQHYPAMTWLLVWFKWLVIFSALSISAHLLFAPYSFLVSPIIYLLIGWRLNHVIYRNLAIDPYQIPMPIQLHR